MIPFIVFAAGLLFALVMWLRNGQIDKVLGREQLNGWPSAGIVVAVIGLILLVVWG